MNFLELQNEVIEITNRSDKSSLIKSTINRSLRTISLQHYWSSLNQSEEITINEGDVDFDLPEDFQSFFSLHWNLGSSGFECQLADRTWVLKRYSNMDEYPLGYPILCYIHSGKVVLVPRPSGEMTGELWYYKKAPTLVNDTDEIPVPAESALLSLTISWIYKSIEMFDESQQWYVDYLRELTTSVKRDRNVGQVRRMDKFQTSPINVQSPVPWLDPFEGLG